MWHLFQNSNTLVLGTTSYSPSFLSLSAIKGCSLESFFPGFRCLPWWEAKLVAQRVLQHWADSLLSVSLASSRPNAFLLPTSLPPKHHRVPEFWIVLSPGKELPWKPGPLQRAKSSLVYVCFLPEDRPVPGHLYNTQIFGMAWLWLGRPYLHLVQHPSPIPAVSQEMRPLLGQLSHLPRHPTTSPAWLGTRPAVQSGKLSNSIF